MFRFSILVHGLCSTGERGYGATVSKRILVVDDDSDIATALGERLRSWGFEVETALDGAEALEALGRGPFAGMTLGIIMPRMTGVDALRRLRQTNESLPVVMISAGYGHLNKADLEFLKVNAQALITKPWGREEFKQAVDQWFGPPC